MATIAALQELHLFANGVYLIKSKNQNVHERETTVVTRWVITKSSFTMQFIFYVWFFYFLNFN